MPSQITSTHRAERTAHQRSLPSLDGLRTVSVCLVILSHYGLALTHNSSLDLYFFQLGQLGVNAFFVISGFLITFLLCKEQSERSTISLKAFYLRRAFRIFPAFYAYMAVIALLSLLGILHVDEKQFIIAGTYLWNYYMPQSSSVLGHTWSLALEEQFYLFWPACLRFLRLSQALKVAIGLILAEPLIRVLTYTLLPQLRNSGKISAMFHSRIDTIMFGCLIALIWRQDRFKLFAHRYIGPKLFGAAALFLLCAEPLLNIHFHPLYHALWFTFDGAALSIVLIYLVRNPFTVAGRLMNLSPMRYVGILSYSLYLWQQLFADRWSSWFPLNLFAACACAGLSFYLIERPALQFRERWMRQRQPV